MINNTEINPSKAMSIHTDALSTIGRTPLIKLKRIATGIDATITFTESNDDAINTARLSHKKP
jgi:hypothetical protein